MDSEEILLVQRSQKGDPTAFSELLSRHDRQVLKLAQAMLGHTQDAQDVFQESCLRAYLHLRTFRFESEFRTWLLRITINQSRNRIRQNKIRRWFSLDYGEGTEWEAPISLTSHEVAPDEAAHRRQFWEQLELALDKLPMSQRTAFTLKHLQGCSILEVAQVLDCAQGTVKVHLFRAIQKLKKELASFNLSF
jgi:RNA polymerase sigma-70 factor, ECF subfamily